MSVKDDQEIMLINTEGILIRIAVSSISTLGRITSGVKLINMEKGVKVAGIAKVKEQKNEEELPEEGNE